MKTLLYLGSLGSEVSTYVTKLMKICCLIITVFLGLSACGTIGPQHAPPPPPTNIRIASVSVDASRADWAYLATKTAYVSAPKLEKAVARAVQRRVSPLAQGSRAVAVTLTFRNVKFNNQVPLIDVIAAYALGLGSAGTNRLHSSINGSLSITDAQSGEILFERPMAAQFIHEKKYPFPEDIQWSENEVNKNLGEIAMDVADEVACQMYGVSCIDIYAGRRR